MNFLKDYFMHPLAKNIDVNQESSFETHRKILQSKPLLKSVYSKWYRDCLKAYQEIGHLSGEIIEIGSGTGFLEEIIPGLIKTDSVPNPYAHKVMDAMKLDFPNESLKAIFLVGVLHHLPEPACFLSEAQRCLKPGGRVVMVEPNNCTIQRFLCKWLNHYEYYDDKIREWKNDYASQRMTKANLALPWVIFVRDRLKFEREFPFLKIKKIKYHTFLSYYVSGGMSFKEFLPKSMLPIIHSTEILARPFIKKIGAQITIDLVKT